MLRAIFLHRNISCHEQLNTGMDALANFHSLKGIGDAVALLETALREQQRILIVADFDADGATSCALALRALAMMGASDVHYVVPNRFEYGYGLTPEIVEVAAGYQPDLLVTVDNGISSIDGVAAARAKGIRVLITDHHLPAQQLPDANAIVNPNQPGDEFVSKNLAGVGVIFYVLLALRSSLRDRGWFDQQGIECPNLATLLDIVALGTVADVVPLDQNNRVLVSQGIKRIRAGRCVAGIKALLEVANRPWQTLVAGDLGFTVGPRLNAAGRLEDMSLGIECLLTDDPQRARELAQQLQDLNLQRRQIEGDMKVQAEEILSHLNMVQASAPRGLCLYDKDWHQGVIGILASRIKEQYHRPVIIFADGDEGMIKGSARSIAGFHIRDALDQVASRHPDLISKFGGHAMAAGLSIRYAELDRFTCVFNEIACEHLKSEDLEGHILSDGHLDIADLDINFAEQLEQAGPWGQCFSEPCFDNDFIILNQRVVGEKHLKLVVAHPDHPAQAIDAIAFNQAPMPTNVQQARLAYRLTVNEFRGVRKVQLNVEAVLLG